MHAGDQLKTIAIWLYIRRYKILYWSVVALLFVVETLDNFDYRATTGLLVCGFIWWLYKRETLGKTLKVIAVLVSLSYLEAS